MVGINKQVKAGVFQAETLFEGIGYAWVNAKPNATEEDIDVGLLAHYWDTDPGHGINLGKKNRGCRERLVVSVARSIGTSQQTSLSQYVDRASQPQIKEYRG